MATMEEIVKKADLLGYRVVLTDSTLTAVLIQSSLTVVLTEAGFTLVVTRSIRRDVQHHRGGLVRLRGQESSVAERPVLQFTSYCYFEFMIG
ncbi:hypothetical protein PoB_003726200 [Plakobranchus ocellatus]|uniref:Uncharacterized protein n=1 Tax=Plakobranchus ocellatus TaxID=259542 RepID=A0AAV4AUX2_9GAST|nr:hypothetical protein PoB_003726200 [Plakobranchus ocellatus]